MPVFCKVTLPEATNSKKQAYQNKQYELKFRIRDMAKLKQPAQPDPPAEGAQATTGATHERRQSIRPPSLLQRESFSADIAIFMSTLTKEPSESNCEMKIENKMHFVFKCTNPSAFIYFTLKSQKGLRLRISLEYLGLNDQAKNEAKNKEVSAQSTK